MKIEGKRDESEEPDAVVGFRALVVFETSVNDVEVRYKIRLMEKHYGSLRHVIKTNRLYPSIYDRRECNSNSSYNQIILCLYSLIFTQVFNSKTISFVLDGRSYLQAGFLALQLYIDKMIILHVKSQTNTPEAAAIDFSKNSKCTCEVSFLFSCFKESNLRGTHSVFTLFMSY